jgi:hypothetical protein
MMIDVNGNSNVKNKLESIVLGGIVSIYFTYSFNTWPPEVFEP